MIRLLITTLLAFSALSAMAQRDSIPAYRFAYAYTCQSMTEPDLQYLDILQQSGATHYYSIDQKNYELAAEKAIATDNLAIGLSVVTGTKKGVLWEVYRNFPETGELTFVSSQASKLRFTEKYQSPIWTLYNETREILGYECKRADADFRGRHWTVWFTEELPLPFGPWELGALPGLILEANDDSLVSFKLVGAEEIHVEPFKIGKQFVKTTRKEFNRLLRQHDADPIAYLQNYEGKNYRILEIRDKNGKVRTKNPAKWRIYLDKQEGDSDVKPENAW